MTETGRKGRVLLLGDARQVHLVRWASYLLGEKYDVLTASLESVDAIPGPTRRLPAPRYLPPFIRYPLAVPSVRSIIRSFRPDLVNAHFLPNYGMIAALAGFAPWVLSTWGSDVMRVPDTSPFHLWRTRFAIGRAAFITSDADVMTSRLVELGAKPDRILTVPLGVDRRQFRPLANPVAAAGPRVISNRKLEAVYDVGTVIGAFAQLARALPGAQLTIAGTGSCEGRLKAQAAGTDVAASITFIGEVPHAEVAGLLTRHDLYVSTAVSDTTSVSLLEAMACGVFPVVSDIPANREWIENGRNGLLVPVRDAGALCDALTSAWRNTELRAAAAAENARVIETRADWSENMGRVDELFERLVRQE